MFGLSEVQTGERATSRVLQGLVRMPLATMPWWRSLQMMNENKGVFGLNMLKWWDARASTRSSSRWPRRWSAGELDPVVAELLVRSARVFPPLPR